MPGKAPHVVLVEARFYEELADELAAGAIAVLEAAGASVERVVVPGALEIPAAIAMLATRRRAQGRPIDGFVALGCVIRGETTHYEIVAGESARGLMSLSLTGVLAIGNGILTVENEKQAWARARRRDLDKGGDAARACLRMIALRRQPRGAS
ncbi:MAG: 6,7-dimethyl-8-ribityllumazine synthase [Alphaproteobacteria bacterium]|nr:6,7-dimethyl-8-ribityllumazine synthase [Alphaproteobacteria bacterium]